MMKSETRRWLVRGLAVAGIVLVALLVWKLVYSGGEDGRFARGNGRIEATEVDVAAKSGGRVAEILVNEGDFVQAGQLVARMDQASLAAQLTQAQAQLANARSSRETMLAQVAQREADVVMAEAVLVQRRAELDVSGKTHARSKALLADRATSAQQVDDDAARLRNAEANVAVAKAQIAAARAALQAARAQVVQAQAGIDAAEAVVKRLEIDLADGDLHAPRAGRVQYRIVQPGEVIVPRQWHDEAGVVHHGDEVLAGEAMAELTEALHQLEELMMALGAGDEVAAQKQLMAEVMGLSVAQEAGE